MTSRSILGAVVAVVCIAMQAEAQIASRVDAVRDGTVRMSFAAREGVCGWGDDVRFSRGRQRSQDWESDCQPGPVRVVIRRERGATADIDTYIGGRWRERDAVTDLGTVSAPAAAAYFMDLAQSLAEHSGKDAILPAAIADSAVVWPALARIGRSGDRPMKIRESAVFWLGQFDDEGALDALVQLVESGEPASIREHAIFALSQYPNDRATGVLENVAESDRYPLALRDKAIFWLGQRPEDDGGYLRDLYGRLSSPSLKERVIFAVSQHSDATDLDWLRALALNTREGLELREKAIFWLGQQRDDDGRRLRELYDQLDSDALREKVIFSISQHGAEADRTWLLNVALNDSEDRDLREKAIFWIGQMRGAAPELYEMYGRVSSEQLRERLIFAYSQRKRDPEAVDKLIDIARNDPDRELRNKAIFWLGQSKDPRAVAFLSELIGQ
jgi:HEAT repeat protein